jgi:hypothetical protein
MSNIIRMQPRCAPPGPFQAVRALHALYVRIGELKSDAQGLGQELGRAPHFTDVNVLATRDALERAGLSVESAAEQILEAMSRLIVEATADLISGPDDAEGEAAARASQQEPSA